MVRLRPSMIGSGRVQDARSDAAPATPGQLVSQICWNYAASLPKRAAAELSSLPFCVSLSEASDAAVPVPQADHRPRRHKLLALPRPVACRRKNQRLRGMAVCAMRLRDLPQPARRPPIPPSASRSARRSW